VRAVGSPELGTKVEIKNLNSIRSIYQALRFEQDRQIEAIARGERLIQETRHWDEGKGVTTHGRSKEFAFDYRYFPEPDLAPIEPDAEWIETLRADLPELPAARRRRFEQDYSLDPRQAVQVGGTMGWADYFEQAVSLGADPKAAANWMTGDLAALLREHGRSIEESTISPQHLADLVRLLAEGTISSAGGKTALQVAFDTGDPIEAIVEARGLRQVSDASALEGVIDEVISENPGPAEQFRKGKEGALNALVGQVMKKTKGTANPGVAGELLRTRLSS
jgi:aspartyl-tRNA(Asn)/glutamyl-tRNA(Gln) amidotransferase subunit B